MITPTRPVWHWWAQRLTALILIPFILWAVIGLYQTKGQVADIVLWLKKPVVTAIFIGLTTFILYHAQLGITVIIEDYITTPFLRKIALFFNTLGMIVGIGLVLSCFYTMHYSGIESL